MDRFTKAHPSHTSQGTADIGLAVCGLWVGEGRAIGDDLVARQGAKECKVAKIFVVFCFNSSAPCNGQGHLTMTLLPYSLNDFNSLSKVSKVVRYI